MVSIAQSMAEIWPKWCRTSCGLRRFRNLLLFTLIGSWWDMWMSSWLLSQLLTERYILISAICLHDFEALFIRPSIYTIIHVLTYMSHNAALIYLLPLQTLTLSLFLLFRDSDCYWPALMQHIMFSGHCRIKDMEMRRCSQASACRCPFTAITFFKWSVSISNVLF